MGIWDDSGDTNPRPEPDPGEDRDNWRNRIKISLRQFNEASRRWSEAVHKLEDLLILLQRAEGELHDLQTRLPPLEAQLISTVEALGQTDAALIAAGEKVASLQQRHEELSRAYEFASAKVLGMVPLDLPLLLLPIRLETKLVAGTPKPELLVRIYPDEIHIDTHEPELTDDEARWLEHFRQAATGSEAGKKAAWSQLSQQFDRPRAAWLASMAAREPLSDAGHRAGSWTRPAQTAVIPDRWILFAHQEDKPVLTAFGNPILADRLQVGPSPQPESAQDGHPFLRDPGIAWMFDFEEAVKAGMGIRVPLDPEQADKGFDCVMVIGVKAFLMNKDMWKAEDEGAGVTRFAGLLDAHHYTKGLGLVPRNTPTNNTSDATSGHSPNGLSDDDSYAIERRESLIRSGDGSDGDRLANALGITVDSLSHVQHANRVEQQQAQAMNGLLWSLMQSDLLAQLGEEGWNGPLSTFLSNHFVQYVRAGGPLPIVRAGVQPYGVLPATSLRTWRPSADSQHEDERLVKQLAGALSGWQAGTDRVPTATTAPVITSLLRQEGVPCRYILRTLHADGLSIATDITRRSVDPTDPRRDDPYDTHPPSPNFMTLLAESPYDMTQAESYPNWDAKLAPLPHSLLYLLLRQATMRVMNPQGDYPDSVRQEFRNRLNALSSCSPALLRTLMAETLDAAAHRLDAWITSVATKRLAEVRARHPTGFCLGGYGWVENLRPEAAPVPVGHVPDRPDIPVVQDQDNKGFVQAPSLAQVSTCAVLRSGYLSEHHIGDGTLAVDLSSSRVKQAQGLLEGVRQGQPLSALLGYGFERSLHEHRLDQYIMPFRLLASFRSDDEVGKAMQAEQTAKLAYRKVEGEARDAQRQVDKATINVRVTQATYDHVDRQWRLLKDVLEAFTVLDQKQVALADLERQIAE
jgi:hypothetical protein